MESTYLKCETEMTTRHWAHHARAALFVMVVLVVLGCNSPPVISNGDFDLWCNEELCGWEVEEGRAERAGTWHRDDYGVSLVGEQVVISQLVETNGATCLTLEILGHTSKSVRLYVDVSYPNSPDNTGFSQEINNLDWKSVLVSVSLDQSNSSYRFAIRKEGAGEAVLGHIRALAEQGCSASSPGDWHAPVGFKCDDDSDCLSGLCMNVAHGGEELICSECEGDEDCKEGEICGVKVELPVQSHYLSCIAPASYPLGQHCSKDAECKSHFCCEGICSACCGDDTCPEGRQCRRYLFAPFQCSPGEHLGELGESCMRDEDCISLRCGFDKSLSICDFDGRSCAIDADCPEPSWQSSCVEVGALDGVCE